MQAEDESHDARSVADAAEGDQNRRVLADQLLVTAAVEELRDRAQELHRATETLAHQNEQLLEAQRALDDERARYRQLFELAPDAFILTDGNGRVVEANHRASALLGVADGVLAALELAAFAEPPSQPTVAAILRDLPDQSGPRTAELRVNPREGPTLDVEATVAAVAERTDGGRALWLLRDVSERVGQARTLGERLTQRTDELERTRERAERERVHLRDLLQRLQEGVVAVDARGNVVYANAPAKKFFAPSRVAEGTTLPDRWHGFDLGSLIRTLFASGRLLVRDVQVTTPTGRVLALRGIPALGSETAGLVLTDVSTRERRERAEREFVANAAHELRTPLTAITGAIEVLQAGAKDDPAERDRFLAHIERECARLGRLSTGLLVLARAQMGVETPRLEVVPIAAILDAVAAETHPASGVALEVSCPPDLAVFANRTLVEQALGNLASNAAKQTHDGTIWLRGFATSDGWVALEVEDTGPGIEPDAQLRAVERFYRAGGAEGYGLGLAIASESARAMGGRLEFDSEPGRGTTARIVLPAAEVVTRG